MLGAMRVAVAAAVLATASSAAGGERGPSLTLVSPGYLYGAMAGHVPARGHGVELSVVHVPHVEKFIGVGLVGQLQSYNGTHLRTALAGEVIWEMLGLEVGWAYRRSDSVHAAQHGLHIAPFVSIGVLSLAWRTTIPATTSDDAYGFESGLALAVKLPIPVHKWENLGRFSPNVVSVGGRPLRDDDGAMILPDVVEGRSRADSRFLADARMEHASIESFLWLADDLDHLGAPSSLVARAARAAEDERRHAEHCLALAGSSARLRTRVHPRRRRARPTLARIAREAWIDGVLGEGSAARGLAEEARRTPDAHRARVLLEMAREEAGHAQLSADILRWLRLLR